MEFKLHTGPLRDKFVHSWCQKPTLISVDFVKSPIFGRTKRHCAFLSTKQNFENICHLYSCISFAFLLLIYLRVCFYHSNSDKSCLPLNFKRQFKVLKTVSSGNPQKVSIFAKFDLIENSFMAHSGS